MIKKLCCIILSALILTLPLNFPVFATSQDSQSRTMNINVAKNKPIYTNVILDEEGLYADWGSESLTDGDLTTMSLMLGKCENEYFIVDLGRRYNVDRINLYDRQDQEQVQEARSGICIMGSNTLDFSQYDILGEIDETDSNKFASQGVYSVCPNHQENYRYIKLQRTKTYTGAWFFYNELEVFADVDLEEVSPGKKAYANDWYDMHNDADGKNSYAPQNVLDNEISMDNRWLSYYGENGESGYSYLVVDLEEAKNIGYVEFERVDNSQTTIGQFYSDFDIYLSNKFDAEELLNSKTLKDNEDYIWVSGVYGNAEGLWTDDIYGSLCNGDKMRYVIYKHNKEQSLSEMGAVRVYANNLMVYSAYYDGDSICIDFSDKLDEKSAESITLADAESGEKLKTVGSLSEDGYSYCMDATGLDESGIYTVHIPENVGAENGIAMQVEATFTIKTLKKAELCSISLRNESDENCTDFADAQKLTVEARIRNNISVEKSIMLMSGVFEGEKLVKVYTNAARIDGKTKGKIELYINCSHLGEKNIIKLFVWDMTDNFQIPICDVREIPPRSNEIYVSPDGKENGTGTIENPFNSIEKAQAAVRNMNSNMSSDIYVYLREGVYQLNDTLQFTPQDSGTNGYNVVYCSYEGEEAEISGGDIISDWSRYDDKIWYAPYDGEYVRNITVNGRGTVRARSSEMVEINDFYKGDISYAEGGNIAYDGMVFDDSKYASYANKWDIQLHLSSGWKSYLLNVEDIVEEDGKSRFKLPQKSFFACTDTTVQHHIYPGYHLWIENAFEELDESGEFYYDRAEKYIYYIPRSDESMETAVVQAAKIEKLMDISGSNLDERVKNIIFDGITFAHAAWNRPSCVGLVNDQAQMMLPEEGDKCIAGGTGFTMVPANITLNYADSIRFTNNTVYDMGAVGIGLNQGVYNCEFTGNVFYDIADSAMTVGNMDMPYEDTVYTGRNLAQSGVITASSYMTNCYPQYAVDADIKTVWSPDSDDECWWQIDLGKAQKIDRVELDTRYGVSGDLALYGINIYGANNSDFSDKVLLAATTEADDIAGTVTVRSASNGEYRYVRFEKEHYMSLANVRIINETLSYVPAVKHCEGNTIDKNYITQIGRTNYGAPAIQVYYTKDTTLTNNYIKNVPYSGICLGWGWDRYPDCTDNSGHVIANNRIENYMQTAFDGGGIYLLGSLPDTEVYGNYMLNQLGNGLAPLYLDAGASHCEVYGNVSENVPTAFAASNATTDDIVRDNYSTAVIYHAPHSEAVFENNNIFVPGNYNEEISRIISNAGLGEYGYITEYAKCDYSDVKKEYMLINAVDTVAPEGEYMSDNYFAKWWMGIYLDSAEAWLRQISENGGYNESAVTRFNDFVADAKEIAQADTIDRKIIVNMYWQFEAEVELLKASKT